jgi:4-oxalocrotonate tautomerase
MHHLIVKLWPGKSEQQKTRLAEAITKDVIDILHYGKDSVSVAIGRSETLGLGRQSLQPDIQNNQDKLCKKPGYDLNDL